MKNLWQEEREVLNHTYINHYFINLISREKFKELLLAKQYKSKEIQQVIANYAEIEKRVEHLLSWANPYAIESSQISELSHLHGVEIKEKAIKDYVQNKETNYKIIYKNKLVPKIKNTNMALNAVAYYIDMFKKESDSIDEKFIDNFRLTVDSLSESLRKFKDLGDKPTILVIDDHYAIDSSSLELSHYDKNCFLEDYRSDKFEFIFCSAFDAKNKVYNLMAVKSYLDSLDTAPDMILLDIMFGDEEFLGVDILELLAKEYSSIAVVIMTSKQKNELFEKTLSMGAVDYLVKPLEREELHHIIYRYSANKETSVLGQESSFLSLLNHVGLAKRHMLIETEDRVRAISLFEYSARVRDIGFNTITIGQEQTVKDIFNQIKPKQLNLFLGLENQSFLFQESFCSLLKEFDSSTMFGAVCSSKIIQTIKQHGFSQNLYALLSDTNIRLENIEIDSMDLLLLFRYHFNRLKPKEIEDNLVLSTTLLSKVFSSENRNLKLEEILKFLKDFLSLGTALNNQELLKYAEQGFRQESYQDLQKKLRTLRVAEFEILLKALRKTQESGRKSNKSLAISKLLDKPQASTNKYDRWIKKVWKEIPKFKQNEYRESGSLYSLGIRF